MYFVSVVSITSVGKHQIYLSNTKKGEKRYLWVDFSDGLKKDHYFLSKFTTTPTVYQAHGTGPVEGLKIIIINIRILDPLNTLKKSGLSVGLAGLALKENDHQLCQKGGLAL